MHDHYQSEADPSETEGGTVSHLSHREKSVRFVSLDAGPSRMERIAVAFVRRCRNAAPIFLLLFTDIIALTISSLVAIWLGQSVISLIPNVPVFPIYATYCVVLIICYLFSGLYSNIAQNGPTELKKATLTTTMAVTIMALVLYATGGLYEVQLSTILIAWAVALFAVPLGRSATRRVFAPCSWWGRKAIIVSVGPHAAERLVHSLRAQPSLGIKPVAVLSVALGDSGPCDLGLPQLNGAGPVLHYARAHNIQYAIVTSTVLDQPETFELMKKYENLFKHWLIIPGFSKNYSLWLKALDLNGILGLEVTNKLNKRGERAVKRVLDLALTLAGGLTILPFCMLIAFAIKIDSRGPVLYSHKRIGRNGKSFKVLKFRSMLEDADAMLEAYLEQHPQLRAEWEATQKLKQDPRVTKLGQFLRKTSLDELPQLINVLRGDMSLVGPRPIVADEINRYGQVWDMYQRTRPGITGQWQISGRNDTGYEERTTMDAYYVRNWSIWLDIYILAKTPAAVFHRHGAY